MGLLKRLFGGSSTAIEIGDEMADGTICAGISPDTHKPMYTTPADAPLTYTFNQAQKCAETLNAHGHKDWRAPTKGELDVLYNNSAAIGGFDMSGSYPAGWYRSSSQRYHKYEAWVRRFSDGLPDLCAKNNGSSLRCVRG